MTDTREMVERVARAICDRRGWDYDDEYCRQECVADARAAIEAMREPSEDVLNFLGAHHSFDDVEGREVCNSIVSAALGQWEP